MIVRIPPQETRRWTGPHLGRYYGTLWKTHNIDLEREEGVAALSQRFQRIEDTAELADLSAPITTFVRTDADCTDRYWGLNNTALFKTDSAAVPVPNDDWDTDGLDSTPGTNLRDMAVHGNDSRNDSGRNKLFVTTDSDISVLNDTGNNTWTGNWWVTKQSQAGLDTNFPHPIEYFPLRKISLVGDGNFVHTISRLSDTVNDTVTRGRLVLPRDQIVRHIFTTTNRAWICCYHRKFGAGSIVEWDGSAASSNQFHNIYGMGILSGVNYGEVPIVVNTKGMFLEYTGQGFVPMVRNGQKVAFPCVEEPGNSMSDSSNPITFFVSPRGMTVGEDGLIYINARHPNRNSFRQGAGVWCLNPTSGRLYQKHSLGAWGDSADYGQQSISSPGAIHWISNNVSNRNLLAGGAISSTASAATGGIWLVEAPDSTTATRGYLITQYIPSGQVREFWQTLWIKFKRFITSGNSIVVKARGVRPLVASGGGPLEKTITWASTTTFTVTLAAADDALAVGDEVEIIAGPNSGYLAHITTISGNHAALQTITIDETVVNSSATATARFERWKKIGTITTTTAYEQAINPGIDSSFVQFKVEMRGPSREMELSELIAISKTQVIQDR